MDGVDAVFNVSTALLQNGTEMFILLLILLSPPVLLLVLLVIVLATLGKSLGIREAFADALLRVFEWSADGTTQPKADEIEEVDASESATPEKLGLLKKRHSSGDLGLIKREKSELMESRLHGEDAGGSENRRTISVLVDDTLNFVTAGVESIIEDQVTSRFKAEQLASWNLLTRNSSPYQHITENKAKGGGICVANHTTPMDVLVLSCDNCYAMIGQKQGGLLGFIQSALSRSEHHIWFERSEAKDRAAVSRRMRDHVEDPRRLPIIIFPEGTCINNTGVLMFKKGAFEIGSTIYPIAVKYDSRLGDAFWNSSEQSYGYYLWRMMTSWAIICDVYYMPPMTREEGEDAIAFARRVKAAIAKKGGLVDLEWDGQLKRARVSQKLIALQQKLYFERLQRLTDIAKTNNEMEEILKHISEMDEEQRENLASQLPSSMADETDEEVVRKISLLYPNPPKSPAPPSTPTPLGEKKVN